MYLLNTERSSSGVGLSRQGGKFSGQTGPRDVKEMVYVTSTCSPPQGYSRDDTFSKVHR